jgi:glycosyltransferase involved in cell wall biosynthesis
LLIGISCNASSRSDRSDPILTILQSTLRELFSLPARLRYRRLLQAQSWTAPTGDPVVNYGDVLGGSAMIAGGRVKLLHLLERWPQQTPFNVLYLVSSAPPPFAGELVNWAKRKGVAFIWNQNGVGFPAWAGLKTGEINRPLASLRRRADYVVYQSEFCRQSADRWLGEEHEPSSTLYNPVDTAVFWPALSPPDSRQGFRLLVAGTHYQAFRVLGALEAARVLLDAGHRLQLTVAGAMRWPDADAQVHDAITRLRLAEYVTLRPAFTQEEAVRLYQNAHVLLHLKYHDPCPTVAIEALACGIPVVATRSGGMPELIGEDGGEILQVTNDWSRPSYPPPRRIAAAVARVMREWPARSAAARARGVRLFEKDAWVQAHARIFEGVLTHKDRRHE